MPAPLLEMERASFGYGGRPVLRGASLTVREGEFVGLVGSNGSGKSTLLRGLVGLLRPLEGRVTRAESLGRALAWVPQRDSIDPVVPATALDVARMGRALVIPWHRPFSAADEAAARAALDAVGLSGQAERPFASLSGGQRRRTLIARALAGAPRLIALDEPTADLDPEAAASVLAALRGLHRDERLAIVMVTHDAPSIAGAADRVLRVEGGELRA